jgi:hypothetical protein
VTEGFITRQTTCQLHTVKDKITILRLPPKRMAAEQRLLFLGRSVLVYA